MGDEEVLKIFVSTDNHLGYCEKDPVRSLDSFAAFEEVLSLAKSQKADLVLLAGDLFHDNKPSRACIVRTLDILRRYALGPNPVRFQVVSDQKGAFHGCGDDGVNYEDENVSVDLPIFSIHGNHDDPSRDGGSELLSAVDVLSSARLVNYYGRCDEVDKVEISPILIRKGESTRVALYGMGSLRDERLNRMWSKKKVRFLRPEKGGDGDGDDGDWFNIFSLHQNRDLGRGTKNCVHESFLPEWLDLVVWGHEHECKIEPTESLVGTFRITQPGSSVATSLCYGESVKKQAGLLEIKGDSFRMTANPLSKVRAFAMGECSLRDQKGLEPEDPKIDDKITSLLEAKVNGLIEEAKAKAEEANEAAEEHRASHDLEDGPEQLYEINQPQLVLVRLKVEHSGFSTLNNQRFGARFVGKVANPTDILLFHRRKRPMDTKKGAKSASRANVNLDDPVLPDPLEKEVNVEDLIKENLMNAERPLEILDEQAMSAAMEDFVTRNSTTAIVDEVADKLAKSGKKLFASTLGSRESIREAMENEAKRARTLREERKEEERRRERAAEKKRPRLTQKNGGGGVDEDDDEGDDDGKEEEDEESATARRTATRRVTAKSSAKPTRTSKQPSRSKRKAVDSDDEEEDSWESDADESEEELPAKRRAKAKPRTPTKKKSKAAPSPSPTRTSKRTAGKPKKSYKLDAAVEDDDGAIPESEVIDIDDDSDEDEPPEPPPKRRTAGRATKKARQFVESVDDSDSDEAVPARKRGWGRNK